MDYSHRLLSLVRHKASDFLYGLVNGFAKLLDNVFVLRRHPTNSCQIYHVTNRHGKSVGERTDGIGDDLPEDAYAFIKKISLSLLKVSSGVKSARR